MATPVAPVAVTQHPSVIVSGPTTALDGPDKERTRILLVEDNVRLAETTKTGLEQQGYAVDVARSGAEADAVANDPCYDVIILDRMLPDRDGVELCRHLRRQRVATPILMLTVLNSTEDKVAGLDAGADDYLTKPFQVDELLARLRSLVRRSLVTETTVLRSDDLELDLHDHQVTLAGVVVKLSAKEFALLEYMMRNPRKLLTRSMICENVWDMNYESSSNVIEVYVSSLRRKLDRGPRQPRIETVFGSGYRFLDSTPENAGENGAAARGAKAP
ncbi:MAG TPA: response regulator transcription factor [Planctomycetota bacterium]|nr:response regulator transcription factor [Planctomycetota bacterium]